MNENRISRQIEDYIDYKHRLGFKFTGEESVLRNFAGYTCSICYEGPLTKDIVLQWASFNAKSDKYFCFIRLL